MKKIDTDVAGKSFKGGSNDVDNVELIRVNREIRNHPVETVGARLRGFMTSMKSLRY